MVFDPICKDKKIAHNYNNFSLRDSSLRSLLFGGRYIINMVFDPI